MWVSQVSEVSCDCCFDFLLGEVCRLVCTDDGMLLSRIMLEGGFEPICGSFGRSVGYFLFQLSDMIRVHSEFFFTLEDFILVLFTGVPG